MFCLLAYFLRYYAKITCFSKSFLNCVILNKTIDYEQT
jgi:hypothetical protein